MNRWIVSPRQRCDLELLLLGGFSPLAGFLSQEDYENVLSCNRLASGSLWPMPITLDVTTEFADKITVGDEIELSDSDNSVLAHMKVTDKWQPNKLTEAEVVFGTKDIYHPGVDYLFNKANEWYLGGPVKLIRLPKHYDFIALRHSPSTLKQYFLHEGLGNVVGFQTRNPIHRAHMELTLRAAQANNAHILLHPVVGITKLGDVDYFTRVRCYQHVLQYYSTQQVTLSLLPLAMRMAGPREALWHALIRKNYGCTHFIIGRDHAGPGNNSHGQAFYDPYAAQKTVCAHQEEIGIKMVSFQEMVYVKERKQYCSIDEIKPQETALTISGTELRQALLTGQPIPTWFSYSEVIHELRQSYRAKHKQGFTIFFTGLSGSGKTTLARNLLAKLMSLGKRNITILDGDVVRRILATELGFSKEDRNLNICRIGYVAAELTKIGGIVLCSAIAPYAKARNENRRLISEHGGYIEIYLSTPLTICEMRDNKGLYDKARRGKLKRFTGIDDPYEVPLNPEITIDTTKMTIEKSIENIIHYLEQEGYLKIEQTNLSTATSFSERHEQPTFGQYA